MSRGKTLVRPEWTTLPPGDITAGEWSEAQDTIAVASEQAAFAASRVFDVREYGAVGDNVTDDAAAMQACADACKAADGTYYMPHHMTCRIESPIDLTGIRNVQIEGRIYEDTNAIAITAGYDANSIAPVNIFINHVIRPGGRTNISIRLQGLMNADVKIMACYKLQLWADPAVSATRALAYNRFLLGNVYILELNNAPQGSASVPGWINENNFYGGRVQQLYIIGDYHHNHNKFYFSMEYATIHIEEGDNNIIESRFEGGATITFGTNTFLNKVVRTWQGGAAGAVHNLNVTDNGTRNEVVISQEVTGTWRTLWRLDANTPTTDTTRNTTEGSGNGQLIPGFRKVMIGTDWGWYADTGVVPVDAMRVMEFRADENIWRLFVEVFDRFHNKLDGSSTWYMENMGGVWSWSASAGEYWTSFDSINRPIRILHPDVAYIRIRVRVSSGKAGTWLRFAELKALQPAGKNDDGIITAQRNALRPLSQLTAAVPAQSLLPKGTLISTPTGIMNCIARVDTTLSANAANGATSISVASAGGMASGDKIAICLTNYITHFTTISSISGTTITLANALPSAASAGREVATQRWIHIT